MARAMTQDLFGLDLAEYDKFKVHVNYATSNRDTSQSSIAKVRYDTQMRNSTEQGNKMDVKGSQLQYKKRMSD